MTFEQWARPQGYRLTKNAKGFYTSPATLAAYMAWRAGQYSEQSKNNLRVVK